MPGVELRISSNRRMSSLIECTVDLALIQNLAVQYSFFQGQSVATLAFLACAAKLELACCKVFSPFSLKTFFWVIIVWQCTNAIFKLPSQWNCKNIFDFLWVVQKQILLKLFTPVDLGAELDCYHANTILDGHRPSLVLGSTKLIVSLSMLLLMVKQVCPHVLTVALIEKNVFNSGRTKKIRIH